MLVGDIQAGEERNVAPVEESEETRICLTATPSLADGHRCLLWWMKPEPHCALPLSPLLLTPWHRA